MLSIGKLGVGQEHYYTEKVVEGAEDHYSGGGEAEDYWAVSAAPFLGIVMWRQRPPLCRAAARAGEHRSADRARVHDEIEAEPGAGSGVAASSRGDRSGAYGEAEAVPRDRRTRPDVPPTFSRYVCPTAFSRCCEGPRQCR